LQLRHNRLGGDWCRDQPQPADGPDATFGFGRCRLGGENNLEAGESRAGELRQLHAVGARDHQVADQHINRLRLERAQRLFERGGAMHLELAGERWRGKL
jgi:hypothetical protein